MTIPNTYITHRSPLQIQMLRLHCKGIKFTLNMIALGQKQNIQSSYDLSSKSYMYPNKISAPGADIFYTQIFAVYPLAFLIVV